MLTHDFHDALFDVLKLFLDFLVLLDRFFHVVFVKPKVVYF